MTRRHLAILATLFLGGCAAGAIPGDDVGPFPADYQDIVARAIRVEFFDPSSLQDVAIAPPYQARLLFTDGWMVCMQANGKNRMGGYTGRQYFGYLIRAGAIVQEGVQTFCPNQQYVAWPQMEGRRD